MTTFLRYSFFFAVLFLLSSCARKVSVPTLATLKPVAKIKVVDQSEFPEVVKYTLSFYSDQRLELTGNSGMDKIGNYTCMLSAKDNEKFMDMLKKFKRGHFTYIDAGKKLSYDVIYFPYKKEISMGDAIQLPLTSYMSAFVTQVEDFIAYKKWLKKENAPKLLSSKDDGNMMVTLKHGVKPAAIIANPKFSDMSLKALFPTDLRTNTWLFGFAPGMKTTDAVYRIKADPAVLGAIPNSIINIEENLKTFEKVEVVVNFKARVVAEDWIKKYAAYEMKAVEKVEPDSNDWVLTFNDSLISAKALFAIISSDAMVSGVQMSQRVRTTE